MDSIGEGMGNPAIVAVFDQVLAFLEAQGMEPHSTPPEGKGIL